MWPTQPRWTSRFEHVGAEREEVEVVRVLQELLCELGIGGREGHREIRDHRAGAAVKVGVDLMQHRPRPPLNRRLLRVPKPLGEGTCSTRMTLWPHGMSAMTAGRTAFRNCRTGCATIESECFDGIPRGQSNCRAGCTTIGSPAYARKKLRIR